MPVSPDHVDVDDCPRLSGQAGNFCGKPIPAGTFKISVFVGQIASGSVPFTIIPVKPSPVSISLIYRNAFVSPGEIVTVRGTGFTPGGNTVHIGDATVKDVASVDGKTITFKAPGPEGTSVLSGIRIYRAWVSNSSGESNRVTLQYR